jgi:serine O-acetyltransferase
MTVTSQGPAVRQRRRPQDPSFFSLIREDYRRHGASLTEPAFVSLLIYRYGRWAWQRRNSVARWFGTKLYGLMKVLILNVTKVWIPPQTTIGRDFHIIHAEGSLSIHPAAVIGDRCGVMHNVTIGTNMGPGAPVIGNDVFIGVNSTVLGPIRIGDRVRIGPNTAVTTNVPSDSIVIGSPGRIYKRLTPFGPSGRQAPNSQTSFQAKES